MRSVHIDLAQGKVTRQLGPVAEVQGGPAAGGIVWTGAVTGTQPGEEFTPDTIILLTQTPQTIINANPNVGHVFQFEAGTWPAAKVTNLTPSADDQVFQGETDGVPVSVIPTDPSGISLGKTKVLWPEGTPTSIMDGGGTASAFMIDFVTPTNFTGIRIRRLKLQNFVDASAPGLVGGPFTQDWIIEENWFVGGTNAVKVGPSMIVRNNRFRDQLIWWCSGFNTGGTVTNPIIIEDNDVADINVAETGDPLVDAGMKLARNEPRAHVIVRRNYCRNIHGPAIWFDHQSSGNDQVYDNITVDCGIHDDGGNMPHIMYEINPAHDGALIHNNWCLGHSGQIRISESHGSAASPILVYENTVDCDASDRQGIHIAESGVRTGGDSSAAGNHPAINNSGLVDNRHFCDHIKVYDNVIRKRNASFHLAVPLGGNQLSTAGGADLTRNFEWSGNKYESNSTITTPFKWNSNMNFATWQAQRAAASEVENTGSLFDVDGDFVVWTGTPQFPNTVCNWEQG